MSAAAAIKNIGLQPHGYSYLCHPSLKNDEQAKAEARIDNFLTEVLDALLGGVSATDVLNDVAAHAQLTATLNTQTPAFDEVKSILRNYLPLRRLLTINAKVKRNGINYGKGLNFLIGGNTLGRGIAIRDLLVTYYIREAKVSQIDTMHQHARMYGYRSVTIEYTRLFIPKHLYYRFREIIKAPTKIFGLISSDMRHYPRLFQSNILRGSVLHVSACWMPRRSTLSRLASKFSRTTSSCHNRIACTIRCWVWFVGISDLLPKTWTILSPRGGRVY